MRVLLLNPSWDGLVSRKGRRYNKVWPPLDLLYMAAFLEKHGVAVKLLDGRAKPFCIEQLEKEAALCDKVFVTSSPLDRWECPNVDLESFKLWTDRLDPDKLFILGVHGTLSPALIQNHIPCRAIVQGESEETVLDICRSEDLASVAGILFKKGNQWIQNPARALLDLSRLPTPAYHLLDVNDYYFEVMGNQFTVFEATRGCPYQCSFCSLAMHGHRYRKKPVPQVMEDIQEAVRRGARTAFFLDLEFTVDRPYSLELCRVLQEAALPMRWSCQTRFDTIDEELLQAMKRAGCDLIFFGVESGSERILKMTNKGLTMSQIRRGMAMTKKAGIEQGCFFLLGMPGETDEEQRSTLAFAKELNPTYASFHVATPYPQTRLFDQQSASTPELRWENAGLRLPEHFGIAEDLLRLRHLETKAYREFYLRPGYLFSRLKYGNPRSWWRQWKLFYGYAH